MAVTDHNGGIGSSELIIANKEDFVSVADAIREKSGTSNPLNWPDEFINTVNTISGDGSGEGSSSSIETCTVQINNNTGLPISSVWYTCVENGNIISKLDSSGFTAVSTILPNVVIGSMIITEQNPISYTFTAEGVTQLSYGGIFVGQVDADAVINIIKSDF